MNTNTIEKRCSRHIVRNSAIALSVPVISTLGMVGASFAASPADVTVPADPTGGQMAGVQTSVQSWVLTYGVPVLFGLTLLGVLIRLGVKWFRKAAKAV